MRCGVDDHDIDVALELAHRLATDHLGPDAVLGHQTLVAGPTDQGLGQFAHTCVLQEIGDFLIKELNVAHLITLRVGQPRCIPCPDSDLQARLLDSLQETASCWFDEVASPAGRMLAAHG